MYLYIREPRVINATPPNPRTGANATSAPRPIRPAQPVTEPKDNHVIGIDL